MSRRVAYTNVRLLDPASGLDAKGALLTEGELIADLGPGLFADGVPSGIDEVIDGRGLALMPGLIDMHASLREPGFEHQETIATAARAAAAGGVTTIVATPDTDPPIDNVALVEFVARRARETAAVRILPMACATQDRGGERMVEMGLLAEAGAVAFSDGDRPIADALVMRRALAYATAFDLLIIQHAEEPSLVRDGAMNEGEVAMRLGLPGMPAAAETIMVERDLRLVALTGGRLHAASLSTATAIEAVRQAKRAGLRVTCGAAPHNFALNEADVGEYRTFAKVRPPLRSEADRQALVAAIADGTIDVIASRHAPRDAESKRLPFAQAAFGAVGLETMLPLALGLWQSGSVPLLRVIDAMTAGPARILKLPQGRLAAGAPADLILVDLEAPWRVDERKLRSKSKNTPYDGRLVQGRVERTVVAARTVYDRAAEETRDA
jgi:dihydroorotase